MSISVKQTSIKLAFTYNREKSLSPVSFYVNSSDKINYAA